MHSRREMANQNGRAHPGRTAHLPSFHRDDDRDRYGAMRDDDRDLGDPYEPGRSWRPEDRGDRRFDDRFDDRPGDRDQPRGWGRRDQRFSESDRSREPYGVSGREDRGEPGRGELRVDLQGHRTPGEAMPRQDQLLRGAYRDHDESSRDLSYRVGPPHGEPVDPTYGATGEWDREMRGAGPARGRMPPGRGPHSGKGPVGFQRSDERIRELVCEALTDDGAVDATHIEVSVKGGEVALTGAIEDRRMKRLAEDCVEAVPGVKDVHNQLRIGPPTMADRSGHGADRTDKHDRHEPADKKHRPS